MRIFSFLSVLSAVAVLSAQPAGAATVLGNNMSVGGTLTIGGMVTTNGGITASGGNVDINDGQWSVTGLGAGTLSALTVTGAGDAAVVLPAGAVNSSEILNGTVVNADLSSGVFANITGLGVQAQNLDLGGNILSNLGVSGASLARAGAHGLTLTTTGATNVTLPTSGTLFSDAATIGVANGGTGAATFVAGILKANGASAFSTVAAPAGALIGDTDAQTITNKTIAAGSNTISGITNGNLTAGTFANVTGTGTLTAGATGAGFTLGLDASTVTGTLTVANGGTGAGSFTSKGVLFGNGTAAVGVTSAGSAGQVLQSNGASSPTYSTAAYPSTAGTAGNDLRSDGTNFVSTTLAQGQSTPADPSTTTSTTGVMMGLAGTITPVASGKVLIIISGDIDNNTEADGAQVQIRTGTGSAPANGAALTGTTRGGLVKMVNGDANGLGVSYVVGRQPFTVNAVVTGLTLNTAVWIDLGLAAITGGTARIRDVSISAIEL